MSRGTVSADRCKLGGKLILMAGIQLKKRLASTFKLHGFSLRSDACNYLASQLAPIDESERVVWLEKLTDHVQKQTLQNSTVEKIHIELAIHECLKFGLDETETVINVICAFDVPEFEFNVELKKFIKEDQENKRLLKKRSIFDCPEAKAFLYRERYTILHQRTIRHELFCPSAIGATGESLENRRFKLRPVEYLLSSSGRISQAIVLGLLTQLREGKYFLEDPSGTVQIDLAETMYQVGLVTENCFVLAEGWYEDKIFHIENLGFPPLEETKTSRIYYGNANTFGGPSVVSLRNSAKLLKEEQENAEGNMIFLADFWVDSLNVLDKFQALLAGYADFPPIAFVLMGNFLSSQHGSSHAYTLKTQLKAVADMILQFPDLAEKSKFIFVPGPNDPASSNILPRPPLPPILTEDIQRRVPNAIFATNPCRIQYCTQEIVVFREDLVTKMCRNTIHFPTEREIPEHFAKSILSQSHLAPLPLSVCPTYWSCDTALQLYPLPDLVVTADQFNSFTTSLLGCLVVNPGSFAKNEFSFKVYIPASRQVEDSQIPEDEDD